MTTDTPETHNLSYDDWEDQIICIIEADGEGMTRSDAQGVLEAQPFEQARQWSLGAAPEIAAVAILKAATPN